MSTETSEKIVHLERFRIKLSDKAISEVNAAISQGQLAVGPHVALLENRFSEFTGTKYSVTTSNGFSALHLAIEALELKGKKIAMPAISSCMAILNAIRASGNEPVFIDSEEGTPNISAENGSEYKGFDAIISPNYFGVRSNIKRLKGTGLPVIEDCAQSAGTTFIQREHIESDAQVYSLYPTKIINGIDGGVICTNSNRLAEKARMMRYYGGINRDDGQSRFNYKLNNINAVFALVQMDELNKICTRRRMIAERIRTSIGNIGFLSGSDSEVPQKFILKFDSRDERDRSMNQLNEMGIPACTELNPMVDENFFNLYPNARNWWETHCSVPCYEGLEDDEIDYLCATLKKTFS